MVLADATQLAVLLVVQIRKWAAVPVADAAVDVIALNVSTPPDAVPGVADRGITTRTVPESMVATLAGTLPVRTISVPVAPIAVMRSDIEAVR